MALPNPNPTPTPDPVKDSQIETAAARMDSAILHSKFVTMEVAHAAMNSLERSNAVCDTVSEIFKRMSARKKDGPPV